MPAAGRARHGTPWAAANELRRARARPAAGTRADGARPGGRPGRVGDRRIDVGGRAASAPGRSIAARAAGSAGRGRWPVGRVSAGPGRPWRRSMPAHGPSSGSRARRSFSGRRVAEPCNRIPPSGAFRDRNAGLARRRPRRVGGARAPRFDPFRGPRGEPVLRPPRRSRRPTVRPRSGPLGAPGTTGGDAVAGLRQAPVDGFGLIAAPIVAATRSDAHLPGEGVPDVRSDGSAHCPSGVRVTARGEQAGGARGGRGGRAAPAHGSARRRRPGGGPARAASASALVRTPRSRLEAMLTSVP
jgi:hypothetical protein